MKSFKVKKESKIVISHRISESLLAQLDALANREDISRNELINQMIRFCLENMDEQHHGKDSG